jgi:vitamin B12 transporter
MSSFRIRSAVLAVAWVPLIASGSLLAQAATPPSDNPTVPTPTFQEEMVVTANLVESPTEEVGSSVTVIGREEIERRGQTSVLDLLRTVPGLTVSQSGGLGSVGSVFIRGADSNHTLVLIDGVRVTNTSGGFDFSTLRADNVERIEILRGPQSTLYGSEAIGGVISITTRHGRSGAHVGVDARAGSNDSYELRVDADGGNGRFDYSLSAADQRMGGLSVASEQRGNTEDDPFTERSASARLGFSFLEDGRADVILRHSDADADLDGFTFGVGPTDDPNYTQERQLSVGALQLVKPLAPWWKLHLSLSASEDKIRGEDPDTDFNNYDIRSRLREVKARSDFKLGPDNVLIAGFSSERRQGRNRGSYDESLNVESAHLQDNWSWNNRLFLTAGVRYDRYSRFGNETTWRATGSYLAGAGSPWKLHGSYGTGFRGPSFDELFFPFLGNLALQPETSRGYDLGIERRFANGAAVADVTWFSNRFEDLINFSFVTFTFENIARASSQGIEASLWLQPRTNLELQAGYTYDDTEDRSTGEPLPRRPRHRASLAATCSFHDRLRSTASIAVDQDRIDSDGSKMDDYTRADLKVEYSLRPWLQPYLFLQNLLDEEYEEVSGYSASRFAVVLGLRLGYR